MTKEYVKKVQSCMAQNLPKFIIALLVMGIITTFMMAFTMLPMASALMSSTMNITSMIMLFFATIAISSFQYVVQYGFFVLVFLLYAGRYAVLGHLFSGFRDFKRSFLLGLVFTSIYVAILAILTVVLTFLMSSNIIQIDFEMLIGILGIISLIVLAFLYVHFTFAWFLLYENSQISIKEALKKSCGITKGKKMEFLGFCLRCSSFYVPLGLVSLLVIQMPLFVPNFDATIPLYSAIASVLNVVYIICMYISLMRFSIAFASWYLAYFDSAPAIEEIDQRIIRLPDYHNVENDGSNNNGTE